MAGVLLAIAAFGLAAFAGETLLAVLEGESPLSSLIVTGLAFGMFLWCARASWRLVVGRAPTQRN